METKTARFLSKIGFYKRHGTHTITIPVRYIRELKLEGGDYVEITITPVMRPGVEEHE